MHAHSSDKLSVHVSQVDAAIATAPLIIGRYALFEELAAGGMATVHLGRLLGPEGFGRTVAVKRLHKHFLQDPEFITMFMDEASIVARIRHPNVVPMVDVVQSHLGFFLVMEYVHGESLSRLMRTAQKRGEAIPPKIVASIMSGVLLGLHSAHGTRGADGELLEVVHRDVSPQNVIVGADGTARVLDFGIAKAAGRAQVTREGQIKGKLAYMAPEQIRGQVDRRTDVFAAAVVLWEMLAGRRIHEGASDVDIVGRIIDGNFTAPSEFTKGLSPALDAIVMRGLAADPDVRFPTARALSVELERHVGLASTTEVSEWVERLGHDVLQARRDMVSAMERVAGDLVAVATNPPPASADLGEQKSLKFEGLPVHLDVFMTGSGEVPSSSAVFAHAQPSPDGSVQRRELLRMDKITLAVVAVSCGLALSGITLGGYALLRGTSAKVAPSATTIPDKGQNSDQQTPSRAVTAAPALTATRATDVVNADERAGGGATAAESLSGARASSKPVAAGAVMHPSPVPQAASATPDSSRTVTLPSCDPSFVVDDVGYRHYKPECMSP